MLQTLRANPALLKLDLYCKGLRLDDSCLVEEDGGRKILRTRAGLGSGLELILPGNLWTNAPVAVAPNIHVSLVMLPDECRTLSPHRYPLQTLKLKAMARVFRRRFERRLASFPLRPGVMRPVILGP